MNLPVRRRDSAETSFMSSSRRPEAPVGGTGGWMSGPDRMVLGRQIPQEHIARQEYKIICSCKSDSFHDCRMLQARASAILFAMS